MILGLIPARLESKRLSSKLLRKINNLEIIAHTFLRSKLAKKLNNIIVCTDNKKIFNLIKKFKGKSLITSKKHRNGTDRIFEIAKKKSAKLFIDIQGDEPLIDPKVIDKCIEYHLKNYKKFDIVLPYTEINNPNNKQVVKVIFNRFNKVITFSRAGLPFVFHRKKPKYFKQISVISFKPAALKKFASSSPCESEKIENIELLRAIDLDLKIGTFPIKTNSFSIDTMKDFIKAKKKMKKDKYLKFYAKN